MHEAQFAEDTITDWAYFVPSRLSLTTLSHSLNIQRIHALCKRFSISFQLGREIGSRAESDKIPDGILRVGGEHYRFRDGTPYQKQTAL